MKIFPVKNRVFLFFFASFLTFFSVLQGSFAADRVLILSSCETSYYLGPYVDVLKNPEASITIDDVADPLSGLKFESLKTKILSLDEATKALWLRFAVQAPWTDDSSPPDWTLDPGSLFPCLFTLYIPDPGSGKKKNGLCRQSVPPLFPVLLTAGPGKILSSVCLIT